MKKCFESPPIQPLSSPPQGLQRALLQGQRPRALRVLQATRAFVPALAPHNYSHRIVHHLGRRVSARWGRARWPLRRLL